MSPQDYPNVKRIDEELKGIQRQINELTPFDTISKILLVKKQSKLLSLRSRQIEFNIANETKP